MIVSFIVATYNRPEHFKLFCQSLLCQTNKDWECIVMDEGDNKKYIPDDVRFKYYTFKRSISPIFGMHKEPERGTLGLLAKDEGVKFAIGEYVSFPCEDTYYAPTFLEKIQEGYRKSNVDFVYCDFLMYNSNYSVINSIPAMGSVSSCNFILNKNKVVNITFEQFFGKDGVYLGVADGLFINELVKRGLRHYKISGILMVYN